MKRKWSSRTHWESPERPPATAPHGYNTEEEVDRLLAALDELL